MKLVNPHKRAWKSLQRSERLRRIRSRSAVVASDNNNSPVKSISAPNVFEQVKTMDASLHRHTVPAREIQFDGENLLVGEHTVRLGDCGGERLCSALGAPHGYLETLPSELRTELIQYHLGNGDHLTTLLRSKTKRHTTVDNVTVVSREGVYVGLGRADLQTLLAADVLDTVFEVGHDVLKGNFVESAMVHNFSITNEGFSVELRIRGVSLEVRKGDVIDSGVRISHSFLGEHPTCIDAFLYRLLCANGAIRRECVKTAVARLRRTTTRNTDGIQHTLAQLRGMATSVFGGLREKLNAIAQLQDQRFQHEGEVKSAIASQLQHVPRLHSNRLADAIYTAWQNDGAERNQYGLYNAMTNVATHNNAIRPNVRSRLAALAGVFATRSVHMCPNCFRVLGDGR